MPEHDSTLPYASVVRHPPRPVSVILYLWGIPNVLIGLQCSLATFESFSNRGLHSEAIIFITIGLAFYIWAIYTFILAQKIRSDFRALRRASRIAIVIECIMWLLNIWFILYISTHSVEDTSPLPCALLTFPIPMLATITRILLRRASRQFPPPT